MARNNLCTSLFVLVLLIAMRAAAQVSRTAVIALSQAHAHNDYHHALPLLDALAHGFCSVEADVFLVDGGSASFSWQMLLPISLPISDVSFSMRRLARGRIAGGSLLVNKSPRHRLRQSFLSESDGKCGLGFLALDDLLTIVNAFRWWFRNQLPCTYNASGGSDWLGHHS